MGLLKNLYDGYGNLIKGVETPFEKKRVKICKACPHFIQNTNFWCSLCPCHMKAKVKAESAKCKINKW
jgi:hypothetical protein